MEGKNETSIRANYSSLNSVPLFVFRLLFRIYNEEIIDEEQLICHLKKKERSVT